MASEQPSYEIISDARFGANSTMELRYYDRLLTASLNVRAPTWRAASSASFNLLAGYIFGQNNRQERIGMTSPVATQKTEQGWQVHFFMPSRYASVNLPKPADGRIKISLRPSQHVAVIRFNGAVSGMAGEVNFAKAEERLRAALKKAEIQVDGLPIYAVYDGPYTRAFMRRNEVMLPVRLTR